MSAPNRHLLFPGGMPESLAQLAILKRAGNHVIGASSVVNDPAIPHYDTWIHLPFVGAADFKNLLIAAISQHHISSIYCPHPTIARYLKSFKENGDISVHLELEEFAKRTTDHQNSVIARVEAYEAHPLVLPGNTAAPLSQLQKTSLMLQTLHAEGQSSDDKLFAMMEIARSCPHGDIVEIGTFWGRSALMLAMLNRHYSIGNLLCIDPWDNEAAIQAGVSETVNAGTRSLDFGVALRGFILNLFPFSNGNVNYLRLDASVAIKQYAPGLIVKSEEFGATTYEGSIALLHIDGNHALDPVTRDIEYWCPRVKPGGWIIIDDYQWAFGDGPQVAADRWMQTNYSRIACAFATGSALFVKLT